MTSTPAPRLVLIEWVDSFGCSATWETVGEIRPRALRCRSVGWLLHDGDDCKVVVPHLAEVDDDRRDGCGDMTIPSRAVVSIRDLEVDDGI